MPFSSSHPLDKFHESYPPSAIVRGPGSVAKAAEEGNDDSSSTPSAVDVVDQAVSSWHTETHTVPLADVALSEGESQAREEDGGNTDDAIEKRLNEKEDDDGKDADEDGKDIKATNPLKADTRTAIKPSDTQDNVCAPCVGCSVDWTAASKTAQSGSGCRGHGECSHCFVDLNAINGTYGLKRFGSGNMVKRETGASAATVLKAGNIVSETLEALEGDTSNGNTTETDSASNKKRNPFVKFVCIPGLPRHNTVCEPGISLPSQERLVTNTKSLQRLTDFCGLESVSTRSWIASVAGTAPAGLPLDPYSVHPTSVPLNQTGIFSSPAKGVALSALCSRPNEGPELLEQVKSHQVVQAALFDFIFCAGDRHTQNVYVSEDAQITLIDNDNLLGEQVYKSGSETTKRLCAVSSLFLPGTMESWRLRRSKFCKNMLGTLDYRCHVGPAGGIKLPDQLKTCLTHFKNTDPVETQKEFGFLELVYAETLQKRSADLLEFGFMEAIKKAGEPEKRIADAVKGERPVGKLWEELNEDEKAKMMAWRDSMWRPTEPAVCHGIKPNWAGAPFDYREDVAFVGGKHTVDVTGAQVESS